MRVALLFGVATERQRNGEKTMLTLKEAKRLIAQNAYDTIADALWAADESDDRYLQGMGMEGDNRISPDARALLDSYMEEN
jgi:hypothetical protein